MSAAVAAILEGMPEPRDLRMHQHDGRCVITAGPVVLSEYAAGDSGRTVLAGDLSLRKRLRGASYP